MHNCDIIIKTTVGKGHIQTMHMGNRDMISKVEAIQKLKKMGLQMAEDHSVVTVLLPKEVSFSVGLKDVKDKMKQIGYEASFCVKHGNAESKKIEKPDLPDKEEEELDAFDEDDTPEMMENFDKLDSLLSLDDDGQFSLGSFGMDF